MIYDRHDRFLAAGLYDPDSPIRVRVVHQGKPRQIDQDFWRDRLQGAFLAREAICDSETTACRVINGESDGFPGLVLDRYESTFVLKLYTAAWFSRLLEMLSLLERQIGDGAIVLRLARNIQALAAEGFGLTDGQVLRGAMAGEPIVFRESGIRFYSNVLKGQKTGFFLDQRENRRRVGQLAKGRHVLNCFSFSGGFSLHAARGGAASVADLDISRHALDSAEANFALNRDIAAIGACDHRTIQANAFDWLNGEDESRFDLIVLDPPSLAKKKADHDQALKGYRILTAAAVRRLRRNGILVSASCSAHVRKEEFFELVRSTALESGRRFREIDRSTHTPDHPATFAEAEYLKCIFLQFDY